MEFLVSFIDKALYPIPILLSPLLLFNIWLPIAIFFLPPVAFDNDWLPKTTESISLKLPLPTVTSFIFLSAPPNSWYAILFTIPDVFLEASWKFNNSDFTSPYSSVYKNNLFIQHFVIIYWEY